MNNVCEVLSGCEEVLFSFFGRITLRNSKQEFLISSTVYNEEIETVKLLYSMLTILRNQLEISILTSFPS